MASNATALDDYKIAPPSTTVEIANGKILDAEGCGWVELLVKQPDCGKTATIQYCRNHGGVGA